MNDTRTAHDNLLDDSGTVPWTVNARPRGPLRSVRVDTGDVSVHVVVGKEGPSDDALCSELRRVLDAAPSSERLGTGARQVSPRLLGLVEALIAWRVAQGEGTGVQVHGALVLQLSRTAITVAHLDGDEPQLSSVTRATRS